MDEGDVRVVLSHHGPLSLRSVRPPLLPVLCPVLVFSETLLLSTDNVLAVYYDHLAGLGHRSGEDPASLSMLPLPSEGSEDRWRVCLWSRNMLADDMRRCAALKERLEQATVGCRLYKMLHCSGIVQEIKGWMYA